MVGVKEDAVGSRESDMLRLWELLPAGTEKSIDVVTDMSPVLKYSEKTRSGSGSGAAQRYLCTDCCSWFNHTSRIGDCPSHLLRVMLTSCNTTSILLAQMLSEKCHGR